MFIRHIREGIILGLLCGIVTHMVLLCLVLSGLNHMEIYPKIIHPQYSLLSPFIAELRVFGFINEATAFILSFLHWPILGGFAGGVYGLASKSKIALWFKGHYCVTAIFANVFLELLYISVLMMKGVLKGETLAFSQFAVVGYKLFSDFLSISGEISILTQLFEIYFKSDVPSTYWIIIGGFQLFLFGFLAGLLMDFGKHLLNKYGKTWPITQWLYPTVPNVSESRNRTSGRGKNDETREKKNAKRHA